MPAPGRASVGRRVPRDRWSCPTRDPVRGRSEGFRRSRRLRRRHNPRRQNPRRHGRPVVTPVANGRSHPLDVRHPLGSSAHASPGSARGRVSEADVDSAMREVRLALLEADVNFKVVKDFVARVRERAVGADVLESLTAGQQVVKIVHEELTALLGAGDRTFRLAGSPAVVALVGLQGSGKTTTAAKPRPSRRQAGSAADARRGGSVPPRPPTSSRHSARRSMLVHRALTGTPVVDIVRGGIEQAKKVGRDVVILDTPVV